MFKPQDEEFVYIPKPGNPNLRYKVQKIGPKSDEFETTGETTPQKIPPPKDKEEANGMEEVKDDPNGKPPLPTTVVVDPTITNLETLLEPLVRSAFHQLFTFIGYIEAETGQHKGFYAHYDTIVKGAKTLDEFRIQNSHLGDDVIYAALEKLNRGKTQNVQLIGVDYPPLLIHEMRINDVMNPVEIPEWIVCKSGMAALRFILKTATLSAMDMAAMELGFDDWRPLVESRSVAPMFAKFVAHRFFIGKGGIASPHGIVGGEIQYRISSGFSTTQAANSKWLLGCKEWFKGVYRVNNPPLDALQEKLATLNSNLRTLRQEEQDSHDAYNYQKQVFLQLQGNIPLPPDVENHLDGYIQNNYEGALELRAALNAWKTARKAYREASVRYANLQAQIDCYRPYRLEK